MTDTTGFAARLFAAIDRRGRAYTNVRFAEELSAHLAPTGRSYRNTTVTDWIKGRSEPPLYVIEAIGAVLGVRPAWLAFGDGPAQMSDAEKRAAAQRSETVDEFFHRVPPERVMPPEHGARAADVSRALKSAAKKKGGGGKAGGGR